MIYDYPFYLKDTYSDPVITDNLDGDGTGSRYFEFSGAEETDYYQGGLLTQSYAFINATDLFIASYSPVGDIIKYDHVDLAADAREGWQFTPDDPRYDRSEYLYVGNSPFIFDHFATTAQNAKYSYSLDRSGMDWSYNLVERYLDPRTSMMLEYKFLAADHTISGYGEQGLASSYRETLQNGQLHVEQFLSENTFRSLTYSSNGTLLGETRFGEFGVVFDTHSTATGDQVTINYAGSFAGKYIASEITRHADTSVDEAYYDLFGHVTKTVDRGADATVRVALFADGEQTVENVYIGGKLAVSNQFLSDGGHNIVAHLSGQSLEGGSHNDTLTDFGDTTFVFRSEFGKDTVRGFDPGQDTLLLSGTSAHSFEDLTFDAGRTGLIVTVDEHSSIVLDGVSLAQISTHDFLFA